MLDKEQQDTPKERGKRLRLVRKMAGLTLKELAKKYDLGISTIKYWECAINKGLSSKGAKKFIAAMQQQGIQCSHIWLMHGVGLPPYFFNINSNNKITEALSFDQITVEEEESINCEISLFCNKISAAITSTIFDDGMEPFYSIGDTVGGRNFSGENLINAIGKNCLVETINHQLLCRRVSQGNSPDTFNLSCVNPNTTANTPNLYEVKLLSAAPITRMWRRF